MFGTTTRIWDNVLASVSVLFIIVHMNEDVSTAETSGYDRNWHGMDNVPERGTPAEMRTRIALTLLHQLHVQRRECVERRVPIADVMTDDFQRVQSALVLGFLAEMKANLEKGVPSAETLAKALDHVSYHRPKPDVKSSLFDAVFDAFKCHLEKEHGRSWKRAVHAARRATLSRKSMPEEMRRDILSQLDSLEHGTN